MFTLLLPGRSHIINDSAAGALLNGIENGRHIETIDVELNGEGSGTWNVTINLHQIIALIEHPAIASKHNRIGLHAVTYRLNEPPDDVAARLTYKGVETCSPPPRLGL